MSHYVLPLESSDCTLSVAGGKGANLSQLVRAAFPVPQGCVITTLAYQAFTKANGIDGQIQELARSVPDDEPEALESQSRVLRQFFEEGFISPDLEQDILSAHRQLTLSSPALAIRSSAIAEDLPGRSFAGQHETYLNVCGERQLLNAVRRCWSSLWTTRALAYRRRHLPGFADLSLAVVVQQMAIAEASGVLFTINPLSNSREEMVINAAWGLGEAVVGGRVTPDLFVFDKATGRLKEAEIADKQVMTMTCASGTAEVAVKLQQQRQAALNEEQMAALFRLGREIEAHFGTPQDIEWAVAADRIYVLQSRPVTGFPTPDGALRSSKRAVCEAPPGDDDWPVVRERLRSFLEL